MAAEGPKKLRFFLLVHPGVNFETYVRQAADVDRFRCETWTAPEKNAGTMLTILYLLFGQSRCMLTHLAHICPRDCIGALNAKVLVKACACRLASRAGPRQGCSVHIAVGGIAPARFVCRSLWERFLQGEERGGGVQVQREGL